MNSKKIQKFVKKIVETQKLEEYKELILNQIGTLTCYISDLALGDDKIDPLYENLKQYFGRSVMEEPEEVLDEICYLLTLELAKKHNLFEVFKICYALSFLEDIQKELKVYKSVSNNVKHTCEQLKIVYHTEKDMCLFNSAKMLEGISLD